MFSCQVVVLFRFDKIQNIVKRPIVLTNLKAMFWSIYRNCRYSQPIKSSCLSEKKKLAVNLSNLYSVYHINNVNKLNDALITTVKKTILNFSYTKYLLFTYGIRQSIIGHFKDTQLYLFLRKFNVGYTISTQTVRAFM